MFYFMQTDCNGLLGVYFTRHTRHSLVLIGLIIEFYTIFSCPCDCVLDKT